MPKTTTNNREVIVEPLCTSCAHVFGHSWGKCDAFPDGIPDDILEGRHDHRKPFGDEFMDLLYEPMFYNEID